MAKIVLISVIIALIAFSGSEVYGASRFVRQAPAQEPANPDGSSASPNNSNSAQFTLVLTLR